jgi:OFA family oxalate/formate antiporter-like MFS transporter
MNTEALANSPMQRDRSNMAVKTRWTIPLAGFLLGLMGGLSYTWGVYVGPLADRFGWTSAEAMLPFTVFMVVFAIAMVPAGRLQDRLGPRRVASAGSLLFFAAYGLAALVGRFPFVWWLTASYGVLGGIACGLTYACVAPPVRKWFPDRPAFAVSTSVMGFGLAALVFAPFKAAALIPRLGIEGTLLMGAVMTSTISLAASSMLQNPPVGYTVPITKSAKVFQAPRDLAPRDMTRSPIFWLLWAALALIVAGGLTSVGLIPSYGKLVLQLTPARAAIATSVFAGFNGLGRPLAGYLGDRFGSVRVMIVTCAIQAITFCSQR